MQGKKRLSLDPVDRGPFGQFTQSKACHSKPALPLPSPIPVTKKWAWKRLLPFWYPVFADASQMIGKIVRRGCFLSTKVQTGFFAVRRSFFHSVKASIKHKVRVFFNFLNWMTRIWTAWIVVRCDRGHCISFHLSTAVLCYTNPKFAPLSVPEGLLLHCLVI